jgi:hypothetical protein
MAGVFYCFYLNIKGGAFPRFKIILEEASMERPERKI